MSLSADEYREHLATTAVRAGFSFDEVVLPQGHYAQVGGMRLHYLDWGNKHLPPMLFLHGGALTAHTWDLVLPGAARGVPLPGARPARPWRQRLGA